jgi:hypothetical protein
MASQGVIGAWNRGRSANPPTNEVIIRLIDLAVRTGHVFRLEYVVTDEMPADPVSRGLPIEAPLRPLPLALVPELPQAIRDVLLRA